MARPARFPAHRADQPGLKRAVAFANHKYGSTELCVSFTLLQAINHGASRPLLLVEMVRWDRPVSYAVKTYSLLPRGGGGALPDPELGCDSPVEHKHRKLARSLDRAMVDRNLQPDTYASQTRLFSCLFCALG